MYIYDIYIYIYSYVYGSYIHIGVSVLGQALRLLQLRGGELIEHLKAWFRLRITTPEGVVSVED